MCRFSQELVQRITAATARNVTLPLHYYLAQSFPLGMVEGDFADKEVKAAFGAAQHLIYFSNSPANNTVCICMN